MREIHGVYYIINKINNKKYIGGAYESGFEHRYNRFLNNNNKNIYEWNKHHNKHLRNAASLYGCENFELHLIIKCALKDVRFFEQRFLDFYHKNNRWDELYNIANVVGGGNLGEEVNKQISETLIKFYFDEANVECARQTQLKYWSENDFPKAARIKMSETRIGVPKEKAHAQKIKDAVQAFWRSSENRKMRQNENNQAAKLTNIQALEIRKKYATKNISYRKLAKEYNVSASCIMRVVKRQTFGDI